MRRTTLVLLVLGLSAAITASPYLFDRFVRGEDDERASSPTSAAVHWARGFADSDTLPAAAPVPWEFQADRSDRPYTLLVELLTFEDLQPVEAEARQVEVLGARKVEKVGPGRFLASDIDIAISGVRVQQALAAPTVGSPGRPAGLIAQRSAIALARHAVTTVAVIVLRPEDLSIPVEVRGRVVDRFTHEPLVDAMLSTPDGTTTSSEEDGSFAFEEALTVGDLLELAVGKEGYHSFFASMGCLSRAWIRHWKDTGEMLFTLKPSREHRSYRPLQGADE